MNRGWCLVAGHWAKTQQDIIHDSYDFCGLSLGFNFLKLPKIFWHLILYLLLVGLVVLFVNIT